MKITYLLSKIIKKFHLPAVNRTTIDKTSKICSGTHVIDSNIERYSYIGNFCTVIDTKMGSFCSIADNCIIGGAGHPTNWVSTSPVFHKGKNILKRNFSEHNYNPYTTTHVGNDVWMGNNCLIKAGVKISDGAVIGMGAVVTKDVGPYEVWAGNPARCIKKRFDEKTIDALKKSEWWLWDERKIEIRAELFNQPDAFLKSFEEEQI